jgi:hypothetical protein
MAQRPKAPSTESAVDATAQLKPKMVRGFDLNNPIERNAYKRSLPRGGQPEDKARTAKLRAEAKARVAAGDTEVKMGRPAGIGVGVGTGNAQTRERREQIQAAMAAVFRSLTLDEIEHIKPIDVFRMVTIGAVKANDYVLALNAADRWAPYVHAKLAPIQVDTGNGVKRIIVENAPEDDDAEG